MQQTLILSVGSDPVISATRDLILRSAGYIVVSAISIKEAVFLFRDGDFDLIILCDSLPRKECERLSCLIRASGSRVPIVCASGSESGEQNAFADATLDNDPMIFLIRLEEVLSRHAPRHPVAIPALHTKVDVSFAERPPGFGAGSKERVKHDRRAR